MWISTQLSGFRVSDAAVLLLADLPVLGLLSLLAFAEAISRPPWRLIALLLTIGLLALYLCDVFAGLFLNARLRLADIRLFAGEWWLARSFVSVPTVGMLLAAAACVVVTRSISPKLLGYVPSTALVLVFLPYAIPEAAIPSHLQKYTGSILLLVNEAFGDRILPASRYRPVDFDSYGAEYDRLFDAPIAQTRRNVILVIVESLSAVDSHRTSELRNILPRFDELSREGMLFRNFFANYEASEGGIVALLSGVPPLHFPTASTNTFGEYALQRGITDSFKRRGYRCEFLTSVPLQFISMDAYARSPVVGFTFAGGQHEIPRLENAPRFAFQSPADHVLYEELLHRLDLRSSQSPEPVFLAAVTASSHPPYTDSLGTDVEKTTWGYVQEELWWLHAELTERGFFDNGLLLITGDHRKMLPVSRIERARYGESAKARVPLLIIGKNAPRGVVDDRLFQQADLLRMLDRAVQPNVELSPFVLWAERYLFGLGLAANASNLEVFEASSGARESYRLKVRGAQIDWITRSSNPFVVERSIHRQRAMQQATREATLIPSTVNFGRDLKPAADRRGMLVGFSADVDLGRDPDDPRASLQMLTTHSFDLEKTLNAVGGWSDPFTLTVRAFFPVSQDGEYWFSLYTDDDGCLAIDKQIVLRCQSGLNQGAALLRAGIHRLDVRFVDRGGGERLQLRWLPPGAKQFAEFPQHELILPGTGD
jgi:hypothetical protein